MAMKNFKDCENLNTRHVPHKTRIPNLRKLINNITRTHWLEFFIRN